jgi:hypothetical protein
VRSNLPDSAEEGEYQAVAATVQAELDERIGGV